MKLIRKIATTLALCTAPFFATVTYAGDCGSWVSGGYWSTSNVVISGSPNVPPADGPGTTSWIGTQEWVPAACPATPPPPTGTQVDCAAIAAPWLKKCEDDKEIGLLACEVLSDSPKFGGSLQAICKIGVTLYARSCAASANEFIAECEARNKM